MWSNSNQIQPKYAAFFNSNSSTTFTYISLIRSKSAICIDNPQYPASLEKHKPYRVLPDSDALKDGDLGLLTKAARTISIRQSGFVADASSNGYPRLEAVFCEKRVVVDCGITLPASGNRALPAAVALLRPAHLRP
jgi:hypothetical protein